MFVFLLTDLEASTRLWEHHPEQIGPELARHDELLRSSGSNLFEEVDCVISTNVDR